MAEVSWETSSPKLKGKQSGSGGTAPGIYGATVTNITATGYTWDGVDTHITLVIQ